MNVLCMQPRKEQKILFTAFVRRIIYGRPYEHATVQSHEQNKSVIYFMPDVLLRRTSRDDKR